MVETIFYIPSCISFKHLAKIKLIKNTFFWCTMFFGCALIIIGIRSIFYTTGRNGLYFLRVRCQRKWIPSINVNKESFGSKKYFAFVICMNPDLIPHSSSFIWSIHCSILWRITRCKTFCRVIIRGHDKKFECNWYEKIGTIDWYKKWYISFVSNC